MFSEVDGEAVLDGLRKYGASLRPEHSSVFSRGQDSTHDEEIQNFSRRPQIFNRKDKVSFNIVLTINIKLF